jgi:Tfp pilus assembly protein PilN
MSLVQVIGTTLVRDTNSRALINRDANGLQEYQNKRNILAAQRHEINTMKSDINNVKEDMQEIKQLLLQLLGKSNG